jgi:nitrogen fixation/metabolism regulation signal transduction histidine kinase
VLVGLIFMLLAVLLARGLVRPILDVNRAALALKAGDFERAHVTVSSNDEIGQLARTFNVMCDVLRQREKQRSRSIKQHEF